MRAQLLELPQAGAALLAAWIQASQIAPFQAKAPARGDIEWPARAIATALRPIPEEEAIASKTFARVCLPAFLCFPVRSHAALPPLAIVFLFPGLSEEPRRLSVSALCKSFSPIVPNLG